MYKVSVLVRRARLCSVVPPIEMMPSVDAYRDVADGRMRSKRVPQPHTGCVYVSRSSSSCVGSDIDRGAISYITMGESTYRLPCSTRRRLFHGGHMTQADGGSMGSGFVCSTPPNKKRENVHDSVRHRLS